MSNIDLQGLSNSIWGSYAQSELGEALGDSEWSPLILAGFGLGINYLTDYLADYRAKKAALPKTTGIEAARRAQQETAKLNLMALNTRTESNFRTAFSENSGWLNKTNAMYELTHPWSPTYELLSTFNVETPTFLSMRSTYGTTSTPSGYNFEISPEITSRFSSTSGNSTSSTNFGNVSTDLKVEPLTFNELRAGAQTTANNTTNGAVAGVAAGTTTNTGSGTTTNTGSGTSKTPSALSQRLDYLFSKEGLASSAGGTIGSMVGSYAGNLLGRLYGDSKGAHFLAGTTGLLLGQVGGSVGSTVASNLANGASAFSGTGSNLASSFSNAGSLTALGAGVANVALDAFDPVKKAGWEHAVNAGIGVASLITPYAALAALAFNGVGHAFGSSTLNFTADKDRLALAGNSYNSTTRDVLEADALADTRYSFWNNHGRHKDDAKITEAKRQANILNDIVDSNLFMQNLTAGTSAINNYRTGFEMLGGYDQRYALRAKNGAKLDINRAKEICSKNKNISKFLKGGSIFTLSDAVKDYYNGYDLSGINFIKSIKPRTEGNILYVNNDEDAVHELYHYLSGNEPDPTYSEWYEGLNDERLKELGADIAYVSRTGDPGDFYNPAELLARLLAAKFRTLGLNYTKEFFAALRSDESKYGQNMRDLLHMYNDDNLVSLFNARNTPNYEYNLFLSTLPDNLRYTPESDYRMYRYWELGGKPKDFEEALKLGMFTFDESDGMYHANSIAYNADADEYEFMKPAHHKTTWMEEAAYNGKTPELKLGFKPTGEEGNYYLVDMLEPEKSNMEKFRLQYVLDKSGDVWKYKRLTPIQPEEESFLLFEYKEGGAIELVDPTKLSDEIEEYALGGEIQLINPEHITDEDEEDIEAFLSGGSINIIPEGALHAHKHHMEDAEHLTKKGIPVVDNNNTQQAEIEREEIIFRLEVTSKLEELQKLYDSEESSQSDKDKAALEAGQLLVKEILHNTIDNTNNLL